MLNKKNLNYFDSVFASNDLAKIMSAPSSEILNFDSKLQFKWTDSEDFIKSFQSQLLTNDQADNVFKTTFSSFLLKKQIPVWIKRGGIVKQYSYYDLLKEHLICGNPGNFDNVDCEFSYYSENGPFVTNSIMQIIGDKNIELLVRFFLIENKIKHRRFRLQTKGISAFSFDDVFMLHGLAIHSFDKLGLNASLPHNYQSHFKQHELFHFFLDTSLFSTTSEMTIEQISRHFSFYERDIFSTKDEVFFNTYRTSDIVIRKHNLDANRILLYIPFDKNQASNALQKTMSMFIDNLKKQLFEYYQVG